MINTIESRYRKGGHYEGGQVTVASAQAQVPDSNGLTLITVVMSQTPLKAVKADGEVEDPGVGAPSTALSFYARFVQDRWQAFGLSVVKS